MIIQRSIPGSSSCQAQIWPVLNEFISLPKNTFIPNLAVHSPLGVAVWEEEVFNYFVLFSPNHKAPSLCISLCLIFRCELVCLPNWYAWSGACYVWCVRVEMVISVSQSYLMACFLYRYLVWSLLICCQVIRNHSSPCVVNFIIFLATEAGTGSLEAFLATRPKVY